MSARFTRDGGAALEERLSRTCERVAAQVREIIPSQRLLGLALAGGYGRGEGGVLTANGEDLPYNDLEFFVFVKGIIQINDWKYREKLHALGETLTPDAGLDVEFKILSPEKLRGSPPSMFFYDLIAGHRWLIGDESLFSECEHHRNASAIPLHEATRLLFNRCSGLLFAQERLKQPSFNREDADFVARNLAKARLALGDVWLTANGHYHWSCLERHSRLVSAAKTHGEGLAQTLMAHHEAGVAFKLHPTRSAASRDVLMAEHQRVTDHAWKVWQWLEQKRTGVEFHSPEDYSGIPQSLCPEQPAWRNILVNFRQFGIRGLSSATRTRYPREGLLRALSLLLWGQTSETSSPMIASCLHLPKPAPASSIPAYARIWHVFN